MLQIKVLDIGTRINQGTTGIGNMTKSGN